MKAYKSVVLIGQQGDNLPHLKLLVDILKNAREIGASSVSILPGNNAYSITCFDGLKITSFEIMQWKDSPCVNEWFFLLVGRAKIMAGMRISVKNEVQRGWARGNKDYCRFEAVTFPTLYGEAIFISFN